MKRSVWITTVAAVLVLLLAGAVSRGRWLIANGALAASHRQIEASHSGGSETIARSAVKLETVPAAEMPGRAPDAAGLFARREDNRLFVGTGALSGVKVQGRWELNHDGPVIEVVTTHDTLVYRDDTLHQIGDGLPSGPVQQVLTASAVDEIAENSTISAWGERRGERLVAEVIVFYPNG
jgi:hypothetical protein